MRERAIDVIVWRCPVSRPICQTSRTVSTQQRGKWRGTFDFISFVGHISNIKTQSKMTFFWTCGTCSSFCCPAGNWRERIVYRHPILRRLSWFPAISKRCPFDSDDDDSSSWYANYPKKRNFLKVEKSVPPLLLADNCVVKKPAQKGNWPFFSCCLSVLPTLLMKNRKKQKRIPSVSWESHVFFGRENEQLSHTTDAHRRKGKQKTKNNCG